MLIAIVAMDPNRVIGREGKLPWHLPEDLAFFKETTLGHPVLMGRKTFESIGRPLPKRRNLVLTRDPYWTHPGVEVIRDTAAIPATEGPVFVIGGAEIYAALGHQIEEWLVSHIHTAHEGDTTLSPFEQDFPIMEMVREFPAFTVKRYRRPGA